MIFPTQFLVYIFKDFSERKITKDMVLQKHTENSMHGAGRHQGTLKENDDKKIIYTQNKKKRAEIL